MACRIREEPKRRDMDALPLHIAPMGQSVTDVPALGIQAWMSG